MRISFGIGMCVKFAMEGRIVLNFGRSSIFIACSNVKICLQQICSSIVCCCKSGRLRHTRYFEADQESFAYQRSGKRRISVLEARLLLRHVGAVCCRRTGSWPPNSFIQHPSYQYVGAFPRRSADHARQGLIMVSRFKGSQQSESSSCMPRRNNAVASAPSSWVNYGLFELNSRSKFPHLVFH